MKLVAEYLVDAIKFDRMAEDAADVASRLRSENWLPSTRN